MKKIYLIFLIALSYQASMAQGYGLSFEEVDSLMKITPKHIVVFLHTDWCKYCQGMKKTSFQDEEVKKALTEDYYFVSFDAESKEVVRFRGHSFRYEASGTNTGVHELARQLGEIRGQLAYPTIVVLNEEYEIVFQWDAFLSGKKLRKVLGKL